jgi:predicted amidohydrolase
MQVCFVLKGALNDTWQENLAELGGLDVVVFGFNGMGLVSYKKELSGETEYFQDVAKLSKQLSTVIICGCDTDTYGVYRHSAVIADKGKILGVVDTVYSVDESEFTSGGSFKVYQTSAGRIGIILLEDLYFYKSAEVLSMCDAEFIVCIFKKLDSYMPQVLLRGNAFTCGVTMSLVAENHLSVSDIRGKIILSASSDIVKTKIDIEKDYHLITSKKRGFCKDCSS